MPIINNSIEIHDNSTDTYFKLEQTIHGIFIYCKDSPFSVYDADSNLYISKNELGNFIQALKNLESNY